MFAFVALDLFFQY